MFQLFLMLSDFVSARLNVRRQRAGAALHDALLAQHAADRHQDARRVHLQRQMAHILAVQPRLFLDLQLVAAVHLRPARQAGRHVVGAVAVAFGHKIILVP